jgi:hypothetical protein
VVGLSWLVSDQGRPPPDVSGGLYRLLCAVGLASHILLVRSKPSHFKENGADRSDSFPLMVSAAGVKDTHMQLLLNALQVTSYALQLSDA